MKPNQPIGVLIVDDSAMVRSLLTRILSQHDDIAVVAGAKDPYEARDLIIQFRPDVIILDIEMPRMDGITFLRKLVVHYPVPVIMCSGVAPRASHTALEAIEIGAIDVVAKPTSGGSQALRRLGEELADKIRAAAIAMPHRPSVLLPTPTAPTTFQAAGISPAHCLVAIGASTGGTEATKRLLENVPADFPPVAIVQHMPEGFTKSYAGRLDQHSRLSVAEARDGDVLTPGTGFVARGGVQMAVRRTGGRLRLIYGSTEPVNRHCPSVDVLFDSVAKLAGVHTVGVLLTGMGADGAQGLLRMSEAGAVTIAQDKDSCVVYGMPKVAVEIGAAQHSAPPQEIPHLLTRLLAKSARQRRQDAVGTTR